MPTKKSTNTLRLKRLKMKIEELNYVRRVDQEIVAPMVKPLFEAVRDFRGRVAALTEEIKEIALDEGLPPNMATIQVDDDTGEIHYEVPEEPKKPAAEWPGKETPGAQKPTAKKKAATKKKAAKKPRRAPSK